MDQKTESISVRIPATLKRSLERKAAADQRTLSSFLKVKLAEIAGGKRGK